MTIFSDFQWKIGEQANSGYTGTTTVFGWDLSGENFVWPDTANLYIIGKNYIIAWNKVLNISVKDYPKKITVSSQGPAAMKQYYRMGDFDLLEGLIHNGRPVWKHITRAVYLFYGKLLKTKGLMLGRYK